MARATGDEKHDESSTSTLDALAVLYGRRPPRRPGEPRLARARPVHPEQGPRTDRVLRDPRAPRLLPRRRGSTTSWTGAASSGAIPTARSCRASRRRPARSATACRCRSAWRSRCGRAGLTEQRVVVLTGDAELNEGSNWEAILLAPALHLTNLTLLVIDNHSSSLPMGPWDAKLDVVRLVGARRRRTRSRCAARRRSPCATTSGPPPSSPTSRRASGERPLDARAGGGDRRRSAGRGSARRGRARGDQHRPVRASAPGPPGRAPSTSGSWSRRWSASPRGSRWRGSCPIVHTITPFLVERPLEQIKLDFGYQGLQGTFVSVGGSYDYTSEGFTHHSPGDVQVMLTVPGMQVLVPGTPDELERLFRAAYANGHIDVPATEHRDERGDARRSSVGRLDVIRRGARRHGDRGRADARSHAGRGRGHGRHGALRDERGAVRRGRARARGRRRLPT